jgi:Tfp pilus assembly protein PilO
MSFIRQNRIIITVLATTLLGVLWYVLIFQAQLRQKSLTKEQIAEIDLDQQNLRTRLAGLHSLLTEVQRYELKWRDVTENLVLPDSGHLIMRRIDGLARDYNLTVLTSRLNFDPMLTKVSNEQQLSRVERIELHLEARGRFFDIGDFISALKEEQMVAVIRNTTIYYQAAANPQVYLNLDLDLFVRREGVSGSDGKA